MLKILFSLGLIKFRQHQQTTFIRHQILSTKYPPPPPPPPPPDTHTHTHKHKQNPPPTLFSADNIKLEALAPSHLIRMLNRVLKSCKNDIC